MVIFEDRRLVGNHTLPGVLADRKIARTRLLVAVEKEKRMSKNNGKTAGTGGHGPRKPATGKEV